MMRKWLAAAAILCACNNEAVKNAHDGSVKQVVQYLEKTLKDPKSFEAIEWTPVSISQGTWYKYTVMCKFRAKNSFGGYVIEERVFYLDSLGNVVSQAQYGSR